MKVETDEWLKDMERIVATKDIETLAHSYVMALHLEAIEGEETCLVFEDKDYNQRLVAIVCRDKTVAKKLLRTLFLDVAERDPKKKILSEGFYWGVAQPLKKCLGV